MTFDLSRRGLMKGGLALAVAPLLPVPARAAEAPPRRLIAGRATIEVKGKAAQVFRLADAAGRSGITLSPGEGFRVELDNQSGVPTIVHWHGQLPPWKQDGFPWPQTPPIAAGAAASYDFAPIPGTFWMHSHEGLQEQSLMAAPLIVRDAEELRQDRQEIVLLLQDFSFRPADELLAGLTGMTPEQVHAMVRMSENVPPPKGRPQSDAASSGSGMMGGMTNMMHGMMKSGGMNGMSMGGMPMDLNDIGYDAFLANDRTLADPEVVQVARGGRVRLRVINGASSSQFWLDLGSLTGHVVAADGHPVHPVGGRRFPLAIAQRLDILIDLPESGAFPILARLEGSKRQTGIVLANPGARIPRIAETGAAETPALDNSLEMRLSARRPLSARRKPDLIHRIVLSGGMNPYRWTLNGEAWPAIEPLMLRQGERVEIDLVNHSMMPHPMHLHGHAFQVVAVNGRRIAGAVRDTVLVPPMMGSVRIAFDADNPGRWAFHCHNLYHMMAGMMTEFRYRGIEV